MQGKVQLADSFRSVCRVPRDWYVEIRHISISRDGWSTVDTEYGLCTTVSACFFLNFVARAQTSVSVARFLALHVDEDDEE